jgi:hypothetical protein
MTKFIKYIKDTHLPQHIARAVEYILIDTCQIKRKTGEAVDNIGNARAVFSPLLYKGLPDIPCRVDTQRSVLNERTVDQVLVTSAYIIELPYDLDIEEHDEITYNGARYEIRRTYEKVSFSSTNEALIVKVTGYES